MSTPVLSPVSLTSFYDPYSGAVVQASLYFYKAQSEDAFSVYTESGLTIPHAQPVQTGGSGRVPPVWIGLEEPYRIRAFDQYGTLLEDIDNLPGAYTPAGGGSGGSGTLPPEGSDLDKLLDASLLRTGDIFASFAKVDTTRPGTVRCNGGTIGNVSANPVPTERGNADCHDLFVFLWQQDRAAPNNLLTVSGGKGTTSEGDWAANKTITLPDLRGRTLVGIDPMGPGGAAASGRMTGATFAAGTVSVPGAGGGSATKTLALTEIPAHKHVLNDPLHQHNLPMNYSAAGQPMQGATTIGPIANNTGFRTDSVATGITMNDAGGGQAFSLVPPFLTAMWFIHL